MYLALRPGYVPPNKRCRKTSSPPRPWRLPAGVCPYHQREHPRAKRWTGSFPPPGFHRRHRSGLCGLHPLCTMEHGRGLFRNEAQKGHRLHHSRGEDDSSQPEHPERPDHCLEQLLRAEALPLPAAKNQGMAGTLDAASTWRRCRRSHQNRRLHCTLLHAGLGYKFLMGMEFLAPLSSGR